MRVQPCRSPVSQAAPISAGHQASNKFSNFYESPTFGGLGPRRTKASAVFPTELCQGAEVKERRGDRPMWMSQDLHALPAEPRHSAGGFRTC
ncbi:hypothetical protein NDU88_002035 [Pleurodeles waltl]|uniref:Uncharacterized protein n=1 Tax=Pleurodeles waltl TaxID=8319 RepID=A0AAV7W248_PLEWA|nr:hypothetical protein NDU88_002035 [Pleurodeles waltl]